MTEKQDGGWQPIETAPKDGTPFLTYSKDAAESPQEGALGTKGSPFLVMAWVLGDPTPVDEHGDHHDIHCYEPTHWLSLDEIPAPPAPRAAGEGEP